MEGDLPSATAAIDVRAVVALTPIVPWFIRGTLPISRLKIRVNFSASLIISLKFCTSGVKRGGRRDCGGSTDASGVPEALEGGYESDGRQGLLGAVLLCGRFLFFGTAPRDTNFGWKYESVSISDSDASPCSSVVSFDVSILLVGLLFGDIELRRAAEMRAKLEL